MTASERVALFMRKIIVAVVKPQQTIENIGQILASALWGRTRILGKDWDTYMKRLAFRVLLCTAALLISSSLYAQRGMSGRGGSGGSFHGGGGFRSAPSGGFRSAPSGGFRSAGPAGFRSAPGGFRSGPGVRTFSPAPRTGLSAFAPSN